MSTNQIKSGLVLEGGAMRGMFTCGVIDVFMEHGIEFDGACGISAGAVFGCNYKSRQIGRAIRYNKNFCNDSRYVSVKSLIKTGNLYGAEFCYKTIPDELDIFDRDTYKANPMKFYVGATDIVNGTEVYHDCDTGSDEDVQWMRASASMPLVSKVVEIDSYKLLDGGMVDSIPYEFMVKEGYNRNVVILTQPEGYVKKSNKLVPLIKLTMHKYPKLAEAMKVRHIRYNEQVKRVEEAALKGDVLLIRPDASLKIGKMEKDPDELERVYRIGRAVGERYVDSVRKFINK